MKIAVLSDLHFGHAYNSELEDDCFDVAEESMEKSLACDLIVILGDIFDSRIPKTQIWAKALKILVKPALQENKGVKLVKSSKELKEVSERTLNHIPVVALHGNHERRAKGEFNTVQVIENAGLLIHLHGEYLIFEKNGERVALHGMSNVPERYAKEFMENWNPKPMEGCKNILLLHQSIDPYVFSPLEPPSLTLSNLPKGFDLILNGHIHGRNVTNIENTVLLIPGSPMVTQYDKSESGAEKGLNIIYTENMKIEFVPIERARKFIYEDVRTNSDTSIREQIEGKLADILSKDFFKNPIIKIKVIGNENDVIEKDLKEIQKKYSYRSFLSFVREVESVEMTQKIEFLQKLREQSLSVEEIGVQVLRKNLEELNFNKSFDYENVFALLADGSTETAYQIIIGEQRTL